MINHRIKSTAEKQTCPCGRECQTGKRCSTACAERWKVSNVPVLRGDKAPVEDFRRRGI